MIWSRLQDLQEQENWYRKNAADTIKKVTLELGGKGGNIVFEDSYPDAVRDGVRTIMSNTGQSCDAPTRMLVQRSIYDRAVKEAVDEDKQN